jgi:hypothetical protein
VTTSSEIEATKTGDFCFRLFQHQWLFCSVPPARNLRAPRRTRRELGTVAPGFAFLGASNFDLMAMTPRRARYQWRVHQR